jgi:hypothetical protein
MVVKRLTISADFNDICSLNKPSWCRKSKDLTISELSSLLWACNLLLREIISLRIRLHSSV